MTITLDATELTGLAKAAANSPKATLAQAIAAVKTASFAVERVVKEEMPVDTGRARASWGHWSGGVQGNPEAGAGDAHWEELDGGLTIEQGSNVDYIVYLNAGHSRQAGAGSVDRAGARGQLELERALGLIDPLAPTAGGISAREIGLLGAATAGSGAF